MLFKIAFRNLFKNQRRTIITIIAISFGYAAVVLFSGFTNYMYSGNKSAAIYGRSQGHLTLYKQGFFEKGQVDPAKYLIHENEQEKIIDFLNQNDHVLLVSPQIRISGLITNGQISTIFIGHGIQPSDIQVFSQKAMMGQMIEIQGRPMTNDQPSGIGLAHGLAQMLNVQQDDDLILFTNTIEGQMNAVNAEALHFFKTDSTALDDKAIRLPLDLALSLYDTNSVDRLAILLDDDKYSNKVYAQINNFVEKNNLQIKAHKWHELSEWYKKVKEMFDVIFVFIFIIVFLIVVMSIINTMSMAVMERTREIGTLRALGLKRKGVVQLFSMEGILLGIFGSLLGLLLTFLCIFLTSVLNPTWMPPGVTVRVPIQIEIVPYHMLLSFVVIILLCLLSSFIPSRRAARLNIVDALADT